MFFFFEISASPARSLSPSSRVGAGFSCGGSLSLDTSIPRSGISDSIGNDRRVWKRDAETVPNPQRNVSTELFQTPTELFKGTFQRPKGNSQRKFSKPQRNFPAGNERVESRRALRGNNTVEKEKNPAKSERPQSPIRNMRGKRPFLSQAPRRLALRASQRVRR